MGETLGFKFLMGSSDSLSLLVCVLRCATIKCQGGDERMYRADH